VHRWFGRILQYDWRNDPNYREHRRSTLLLITPRFEMQALLLSEAAAAPRRILSVRLLSHG
jgi:hypothetical protein